MKARLACAALFLMLSLAVPAAPQSCPPENPSIICGFYCSTLEATCWGPAEPTRACADYAGCIDWHPSPECSCGGGF